MIQNPKLHTQQIQLTFFNLKKNRKSWISKREIPSRFLEHVTRTFRTLNVCFSIIIRSRSTPSSCESKFFRCGIYPAQQFQAKQRLQCNQVSKMSSVTMWPQIIPQIIVCKIWTLITKLVLKPMRKQVQKRRRQLQQQRPICKIMTTLIITNIINPIIIVVSTMQIQPVTIWISTWTWTWICYPKLKLTQMFQLVSVLPIIISTIIKIIVPQWRHLPGKVRMCQPTRPIIPHLIVLSR